MHLAGEESTALLDMGGEEYAAKKLRRWRGEGPTERNKKMAQFLIKNGSLRYSWSRTPPKHPLLLIDLAVEWGDFAMWKEVLKKNPSEVHTAQLSLDVVMRALDVFTFDRIKNTLVHSTLAPMPYFLCSCFPPFNMPCRIEKVIRNQPGTRAAIDWIRAFQAHASGQDPNVKTWLKQQTAAVLSSINSPPSDKDVQMFVSIAKSEGLLFFSKVYVPAGGRDDSSV